MTNLTEEDRQKMDSAAIDAQNDLENVSDEALAKVANWWKKWYLKAGHRRLARILLEFASE